MATFSNPQGNVALKGWFGLPNTDQSVLELSRLCVLPQLNGTNATSFLLSTSIRLLKKEGVRAVITLADDSRHSGSIYQVCNFTYYGLTDKKSDFFSSDFSPFTGSADADNSTLSEETPLKKPPSLVGGFVRGLI